MKKKFYLAFLVLSLFALFAFVGCDQAITPESVTPTVEKTVPESETTETTETPEHETPEVGFFVKNSVWDNVDLTKLPQYIDRMSGRSVGGITDLLLAQEIVAEYNAETDGDQIVILTEDVPIEESPDVTIYFAKAVNGFYEIHSTYDLERSYYKQYKQGIEQEAAGYGCIVFVDKVPETAPPPYVDPRTPYEKYSIYVVEEDGSIAFEEHCTETFDLYTKTVPGFDYESVDTYFSARLIAFTYEAYTNNRRVVSGQIYTPPVE